MLCPISSNIIKVFIFAALRMLLTTSKTSRPEINFEGLNSGQNIKVNVLTSFAHFLPLVVTPLARQHLNGIALCCCCACNKVNHPLAPGSYGNVHGQRIKEEDVLQHFLTFDFQRCRCLVTIARSATRRRSKPMQLSSTANSGLWRLIEKTKALLGPAPRQLPKTFYDLNFRTRLTDSFASANNHQRSVLVRKQSWLTCYHYITTCFLIRKGKKVE